MDNDLISRSALGIGYADPLVFDNPAFAKGWNAAIEIIAKVPAVDAVEVVRCTECQYMKIKAGLCYCKVWQGYNSMGSEGFCSYGERRSDGT